jgi:hypothetical protein
VKSLLLGASALLAFGQPVFSSPQETCGRADPAYIRTANETGGIPMFLQPSETGKAFHLVRETTRNNISTVLWATGSLDGQAQTAPVPVDSTSRRVTFAFSSATEGSNIKIVPPSGTAIAQTSANTEITELRCGRIVTVASPEPGTWRVELTGKGRFWIEVQVQSDIHFLRAEFVREAGRPGHEGFFRIDGQPVAGKPAMIRASISAEGTRNTEFYLASERGEIIQELQMHAVDSAGDEFMGTADLPHVPFRVAVTGIDGAGKQYQRFFASLFRAENLEVSWNRTFDELPAGNTQQVQFTVFNTGASGTFKVTAVDAHQFVAKVEPAELALASGQSGTILINLSVPAATKPGTGDDVIVVATSTSGPVTSNSSVAHFSVVAPGR